MSNKTISINPSLFTFGKTKTKKNREKNTVPKIQPIISPSVLKNKLLKRIKQHKEKETENLENNKRKLVDPEEKKQSGGNTIEQTAYSDEFSDSLNYLQTLSKQKKVDNEKINYEKQKQKRREELERHTVKNYASLNSSIINPYVNIDLPEELQQPIITVNTDNFKINGTQTNMINPYKNDNVPYGILKGGLKPSYKVWNTTQRNNIVTNPSAALTIENLPINKEKNERENRLYNLREKLKLKQIEETNKKTEESMITQNLIHKPKNDATLENIIINTSNETLTIPTSIQSNIQSNIIPNKMNEQTGYGSTNEEIIAIKKITKRTIKRKYTLGKSKIKKTISVLVKDRGTRKKIINAQKELKRKPMNEIKNYLRDHNLIKVGSNAPNDVLRKLYESSMLAGEITNTNSETLLHNFSKNDKEM